MPAAAFYKSFETMLNQIYFLQVGSLLNVDRLALPRYNVYQLAISNAR